MERIFIVALLMALCSAESPPIPSIIPIQCNETLTEMELAIDLINEKLDEGFLLRPLRLESIFMQESQKLPGGLIYYLDMDVLETDCSVLSRKSWKDCQHDIPMHETVFGHCKAIIFIDKTKEFEKLIQYNCTLGTVPPSEIVHICPDCPLLVKDITSDIEAKADLLIQKFNKESNHTHYFKVDDIERVRTQHVSGPSYFFYFTIKETECLKTQTNVHLSDCKFLKDHEAEVGFCNGGTYFTSDNKGGLKVSCEIYEPFDDDNHGRRHGHCDHRPHGSKIKEGHAEGADVVKEKQEATGEEGQGKEAPGKHEHHEHGHFPHQRGRKHHHCRPHHHHHHDHHHPHHHHHHHFGHENDSHPHHHHHHHHHHDHNHTSSIDGSSSEEHTDNKPPKPFEKRSKGSVQFYDLTDAQSKVPIPTIFRLPPPPPHPGKHGKLEKHGEHDIIEFPSEHSKLNTCPGEALVDIPDIIKHHIF